MCRKLALKDFSRSLLSGMPLHGSNSIDGRLSGVQGVDRKRRPFVICGGEGSQLGPATRYGNPKQWEVIDWGCRKEPPNILCSVQAERCLSSLGLVVTASRKWPQEQDGWKGNGIPCVPRTKWGRSTRPKHFLLYVPTGLHYSSC